MRTMRIWIIGVVAFLLAIASLCNAWQVTLAWDAPSSDPSTIGGYNLYYRRPLLGETTYITRTNVGNVLTFRVINMDPGTEYCFVATAYGTMGEESGFSNEVCETQPVVSFIQPHNGDTVSGIKLISIYVDDAVHPGGADAVTIDINNTGIWQPVTYNTVTQLYEISWDTRPYGTTSPQSVDLNVIAITPSPGNIPSDPTMIIVNVDNRPVVPMLHIGDLDNMSGGGGPSYWTPRVQVTVHDASHALVSAATVTAAWQNGGTGVCTTDGTGKCVISTTMPKKTKTVTLSVTGIQKSGSIYESTANHDPDGDSNGTSITFVRP